MTNTNSLRALLTWANKAPATCVVAFPGNWSPEAVKAQLPKSWEVIKEEVYPSGNSDVWIKRHSSGVSVYFYTNTVKGVTMHVIVPGTRDLAHENFRLGVSMGHSD